jgi:hypothetical protein
MNKNEKRLEKERQVKQFYMLLKAIMDELFRYTRSRHIKIPDASFGLVYEEKDSILFTSLDSKTGRRIYLYNVRLIAKSFEEKREKMLSEKTPDTFLNWIGELCFTFVSPFVYNYVVKEQHRGEGTSERITRQIVRGFMNKLLNDPELSHVLDIVRTRQPDS